MTAKGPAEEPLRLVVLADSTAFINERGPQLPTEPTLYPNVLARLLEEQLGREVTTQVVARAGLTVRDAWRLVSKDRHVQFEVLAGADAVVVGLGGFDHAPLGVPEVLQVVVPYLRPAKLRTLARKALHKAYPVGAHLLGRVWPRTPETEFSRLYDLVLRQVRGLTQGAPGLALGPTTHHDSPYYARHRAGYERRALAQLDQAAGHGFATLPVWPFVEPAVDRLNVDGIHWPAEVHAAVAEAAAPLLLAQLRGEVPSPPVPGAE